MKIINRIKIEHCKIKFYGIFLLLIGFANLKEIFKCVYTAALLIQYPLNMKSNLYSYLQPVKLMKFST